MEKKEEGREEGKGEKVKGGEKKGEEANKYGDKTESCLTPKSTLNISDHTLSHLTVE